jgi:hypothetical protein
MGLVTATAHVHTTIQVAHTHDDSNRSRDMSKSSILNPVEQDSSQKRVGVSTSHQRTSTYQLFRSPALDDSTRSLTIKMDDDRALFETIELFLNETKYAPGPPEAVLPQKFNPARPLPFLSPLSPAVTLPTTSKPPVKERRKRHIEIQLLRDQVVQLESLHAVLAKRQQEADVNKVAPVTSGLAKWKAIAVRELQRREQSMATNLELRKLVRSRTELARRVFKQVGHQQRLLAGETSRETNRSPDSVHMQVKVLQHKPIYCELANQISGLYERTNHVLNHPQLPTTKSLITRLRDIKTCPGDSGRFLDAIDARLVPFDLVATANAVWHWLTSAYPVQFNFSDVNVLDDHTLLASISGMMGTFSCRGSIVVRRFDEPDRVVFVKAVVVDQKESKESEVVSGGQVIRVSEWIVLYRPVDDAQNVLPSCTEIIVRNLTEQDTAKPKNINARLHGMAAHQLTTHLDNMHESVDNALLTGGIHQR